MPTEIAARPVRAFFVPANREGRMPTRVNRGLGPQFTRAFTARGDWVHGEPGSPVPMVASTPGRKRDGLDLRPDRWRVDNYHRAGGPILWQHDHKIPPLGNGRAKIGSDKLRVEVTFDQEDEFARKIESKLRRGFLNSASCGWDFVDLKSGEVLSPGRGFASSLARDAGYDLSEISMVAVPADPQAVAERHWNALRSVSPDLADLYNAQERWDSDVTEPQLRAALIAYCAQLGLDLGNVRGSSSDGEEPTPRKRRKPAGPAMDDMPVPAEEEDDADGDDGDGDQGDEKRRSQTRLVRRSQLPELLRSYGLHPKDPAAGQPLPTAPAAVSDVDRRAVAAVLDAFPLR